MANKLYAVIIGINAYPQKPLNGCINDALAIQDYFQKLLGKNFIPQFLLAPFDADDTEQIKKRGIDAVEKPSRKNIIAAFDHFAKAEDGDFCLLYYSGHGSTASAPEVFKGYEPGDLLQTLVCVDSRVKNAPDILDKEVGYLIAKALEGKEPGEGKKGVHFLAIIDSCHSGTVTRGDDLNAPVARMTTKGFAPDQITGFSRDGNCFYTPFKPGQTVVDPNGGIRHARHVNLSAARNSESAYELYFDAPNGERQKRGAFTWCLLETLRQNGTNLTYAELIRRVETVVRARVDNQIPLLGKTEVTDDNLLFLRNEFQAPIESFPVVFDQNTSQWKVKAGTINGLPASNAKVRIGNREVSVKSVGAGESILESVGFTEQNKEATNLSATLDVLPAIKIGLSEHLNPAMADAVKAALAKQKLRYAALAADGETPQYLIGVMPDKEGQPCFVLLRPGSSVPLFMRTPNATQFVRDLGKVARYDAVLLLNNPTTSIPKNAVSIDIKTLEGVLFNADTLADIPENKYVSVNNQSDISPYPEVVRVSGKTTGAKIQQPAIKVRVSVKEGSYWVGALYCDAKYGIETAFLNVQKIGGPGEDSYADLKFKAGGREYLSIPLKIDKNWKAVGVSEIQDYLMIFVSDKSFELAQYKQDGVELDTMRDAGFDDDERTKDDWTVIKIPIQIAIPKGKQDLAAAVTGDFGAFSIQMPDSFKSTVEAVNRSGFLQGKGVDNEAFLPPSSLWDGVEGAPEVFARGVSSAPDAHLSMIELTNIAGSVDAQHPMTIIPRDPLGVEEAIVPFGYDGVSGLYYPLGYTDDKGQVRIERLPEETSGQLGQPIEGQKSLPGSLKLFFQKVVWSRITGRKRYNRLSLVALDNNGDVLRTDYFGGKGEKDNAALGTIQTAVSGGGVLLLLHGIIGDTDDSAPTILKRPEIAGKFKAVLTFDYENLDSQIQDIARGLLLMLRTCAVPEKSITIVAHSMGGLVSRWVIEQEDGSDLIAKLIQIGTPNGGSEIGDFRKKLTGWITLGINGITAVKPYLAFCSLIWKGLEKSLFRTLDQMQPDSKFLQQLNGDAADRKGVQYYLITGDTSIIESSAGEDETVWRQVVTGLKERGKYILADYALFDGLPNDMAVRVESARSAKGGFVAVEEVACDHVSYFKSGVVMGEVERLV